MPPSTSSGDILRVAADLVDGPREVEHGSKERSFNGIAAAWQAFLMNRAIATGGVMPTPPLTGIDVAQMMVLLKMTRAQFGSPNPDHFLDQCGYSGIAAGLASPSSTGSIGPMPQSELEGIARVREASVA